MENMHTSPHTEGPGRGACKEVAGPRGERTAATRQPGPVRGRAGGRDGS